MTPARTLIAEDPRKEARTANWVAAIVRMALVFDGVDLTVYGTVLSTLLDDPSQIGRVDAATAGALGAYALIGVLVGPLTCGFLGDHFGRRRLILGGIAWFSIGMFVTALTTTVATSGLMRFLTGLGLGVIHAWFELPESPRWLLSRGRTEETRAAAAGTGVPLLEEIAVQESGVAPAKRGFAAAFSRQLFQATVLLGFMSFSGLLLTYGLHTWSPRITEGYGFSSDYYTANARAAGVSWVAGFGRIGGVLGPLIGGWLAAAGIGGATAFYIVGGMALFGAVVTVLVPRQHRLEFAERVVAGLGAHPDDELPAGTVPAGRG